MRAQKKQTEEEVERELIEDAGNPDAWEPPIAVRPIRSPRRSSYRKAILIATTEKKSGVSEK